MGWSHGVQGCGGRQLKIARGLSLQKCVCPRAESTGYVSPGASILQELWPGRPHRLRATPQTWREPFCRVELEVMRRGWLRFQSPPPPLRKGKVVESPPL